MSGILRGWRNRAYELLASRLESLPGEENANIIPTGGLINSF
jgi:hypothetical protein